MYGKYFKSITEFSAFLNNGTTQPGFREKSIIGSYEFTQTHSYEEAEQLLMYGAADIQKRIEAAGVSRIRAQISKTQPQRKIFANVVGAAAHVPNYIAGLPCAMIDARKKRVPAKVLTLAWNCSASGEVSGERIIKASAAFLGAVLILEASGIRCNVVLCEMSRAHGGKKEAFAVLIKDSRQHLDTLKCAYTMAHPSMLRRHLFRFTEVYLPVEWADGYGSPIHEEGTERELLNELQVKPDVIMNISRVGSRTPEEVCKYILNQCGRK